MNQKFFELNEEKRLAIINAGLEVFSKNDYKHALTADIAAKAGISKGLLFYYFHNKKTSKDQYDLGEKMKLEEEKNERKQESGMSKIPRVMKKINKNYKC